jgi:hypothetical protein
VVRFSLDASYLLLRNRICRVGAFLHATNCKEFGAAATTRIEDA